MVGQVEGCAALGYSMRVFHSVWVRGEQLGYDVRWPEKEFAVGSPQAVGALQRRAVFDRHHRVLQTVTAAYVVVDVTRCDDR